MSGRVHFGSLLAWRNCRYSLWRYFQSVLLVLFTLAISIPLHYVIEPVNLVMLFLAAVVLASAFLGRGPAILASLLSVLSFDFFLTEPRLSLSVADTQYLLTFFGLLAVGLVISTTVAQLRDQVEIIRQREAHTAALNSLSRELAGAVNLEDMLRSAVEHIHHSFDCRVVILLPVDDQASELGRVAADSASFSGNQLPDELAAHEWRQANQVYHSASVDLTTPYPASRLQFLALLTSLGPVGVLGLELSPSDRRLEDQAQRNLLQGFANLTALAIERARLAREAAQAQVLKDIERLQSALLNSISHELRTPLVSITGALSALAEEGEQDSSSLSNPVTQRELIETAYEDARRMNLLVGNLLDMSRLESGALHLSLEPCDLQDLVGIALERFGERRRERVVRTVLADDLPFIEMDVALMVEVLVNLLENAAKYSPPDTPIDLVCRRVAGQIEIEVADRGPGIPPEDLMHIFDKFYRSPKVRNIAGLGLGLSISKGIVEAHGGAIRAQNREDSGLSIILSLSAQDGEGGE